MLEEARKVFSSIGEDPLDMGDETFNGEEMVLGADAVAPVGK